MHLGDVAVCDPDGHVVAAAGDPERLVYARSSMKPLQAAVSLSRIDGELPSDLVAIMCASHNGEPDHVGAVRRLLRGGGVPVTTLRCPEDLPSRRADALAVARKRRIFHNCSGKHAGMLRACASTGWDLETYRAASHPLQRAVNRAVERATGIEAPHVGVDGCGVPVHGLPLRGMATLFARLASPGRLGGLEPPGRAAVDAMRAHPFLVAGTGRADTAIMEAAPNVIAKVGAEALFCASILDRGLGIAVKIADGGDRASGPALIGALRTLDAIDDDQRSRTRRGGEASAPGRRRTGGRAGRRRRAGTRLILRERQEREGSPRPAFAQVTGTLLRMAETLNGARRPRVAVVSLHTSPLDQPGTGDSGGMNVFIRQAAERLGELGVDVDVFTRCRGGDLPEVEDVGDARVIRVKAGPCEPVPKDELPRYLAGVPRRGPSPACGRTGETLRRRPHPLLAVAAGSGSSTKEIWGVAARGVVPHARQGEELLRRPGRDPRVLGAPRGRGARDRRRRPDPRGHARGGRAARRAVRRRPRAASASSRRASTTTSSRRATCDEARARLHLAGMRLAAVRRPAPARTRARTSPCARSRRRSRATTAAPASSMLAIVGGPSGTTQGAELARADGPRVGARASASA